MRTIWDPAGTALPGDAPDARPGPSITRGGDGPAHDRVTVLAWAILFVAGLFEVAWAIGLKYTEGFTRLVPSALTLAAMGISGGCSPSP